MNVDRAQVLKMSGPELVTAYQQITGEKVKRFSDRKSGVKRVLDALNKAQGLEPALEPAETTEPAQTAANATVTEPPSGPAAKPRRVAAFAVGGEAVPARAGSKRAQLIERLRSPKGISIEEAMEAYEWARRDVMDALRLTAKKNGFPVHQGDDGRFRIANELPAQPVKLAAKRKV